MQPVPPAVEPAALTIEEEAALLLAGSVLEHLLAGRTELAGRRADQLGGLLDLV